MEKEPESANWHAMTQHFPCLAMVDADRNSSRHTPCSLLCEVGWEWVRVTRQWWSVMTDWLDLCWTGWDCSPTFNFQRRTWWHHQMETFSALLVVCEGHSPVTGEFPSQRPVTRSFDVFFDLRLNKWFLYWANHRDAGDLRRHRCPNDAIVMIWPTSHRFAEKQGLIFTHAHSMNEH